MNKVQNFEFVECVVPQSSTGTRFYFNDQPQLRFVSMTNLVCYTPASCTTSVLSGNTNLALTNLARTFIVLYYNDKESVDRMPVLSLNMVASNSGTAEPYVFQPQPFAGQQIIWSKSYIQTTTAYTGIGTGNFSACFGVYYA